VEGTTRAAEGLEEGDLEGLAEEVRAAAARTSEKIGSRFEGLVREQGTGI
jgi:hypothetical protein